MASLYEGRGERTEPGVEPRAKHSTHVHLPVNGHLKLPPGLGVEKISVFGLMLSFHGGSTLSPYLKAISLRINISKHWMSFAGTTLVEEVFNVSLF